MGEYLGTTDVALPRYFHSIQHDIMVDRRTGGFLDGSWKSHGVHGYGVE